MAASFATDLFVLYPRLWIDLDNSPHVLLFAPVVRRLRHDGWDVLLTARDFAQTLDLVEQLGLEAIAVGAHAGRSKVRKVANLPVRALQLMRAVRSFAPQLALSHGSRTQAIASSFLGVPQIVMFDYEWTEMTILQRLARWLLCPRALTRERLEEVGIPTAKVEWYDGMKEEIYLAGFEPDPGFRASIGIASDARLVTIRPPGLIGNYHDAGSERLCVTVIEHAVRDARNHVVILPKTRLERKLVDAALPPNPQARVVVPDRALPGLQLLAASDIAVSGGGTMNRESALLGVPTYSIFTGRRAAVDEDLERRGLLRFITMPEEVGAIDWDAPRLHAAPIARAALLDEICAVIEKFGNMTLPGSR